jgi:sugar-specific transcriptional regulator TrmB
MKKKEITQIKKIEENDPLRDKKRAYIEGVNRIGDLITSINRDMENRIMVFISVIISGLLGVFLSNRFYLISFLLGGILLVLLTLSLLKENNDKNSLKIKMRFLVKDAKDKAGINLEQGI